MLLHAHNVAAQTLGTLTTKVPVTIPEAFLPLIKMLVVEHIDTECITFLLLQPVSSSLNFLPYLLYISS